MYIGAYQRNIDNMLSIWWVISNAKIQISNQAQNPNAKKSYTSMDENDEPQVSRENYPVQERGL